MTLDTILTFDVDFDKDTYNGFSDLIEFKTFLRKELRILKTEIDYSDLNEIVDFRAGFIDSHRIDFGVSLIKGWSHLDYPIKPESSKISCISEMTRLSHFVKEHITFLDDLISYVETLKENPERNSYRLRLKPNIDKALFSIAMRLFIEEFIDVPPRSNSKTSKLIASIIETYNGERLSEEKLRKNLFDSVASLSNNQREVLHQKLTNMYDRREEF